MVRGKEVFVEDRMDTFPRLRDVEFVGTRADFLNDLKGSPSFISQFLHWSISGDVDSLEPHFIAWVIFDRVAAFLVVVVTHIFCCLFQGRSYFVSDFLHIGSELFGGGVVGGRG